MEKKLKLSYKAIALLKFILTFTGEKELNERGQEVNSPRRLVGEEPSQRRHFIKNTNEFMEGQDKKREVLLDKAKESWKKKNKKNKDEAEPVYTKRMENELNRDEKLIADITKLNEEISDLNLTEKTFEVVKKYYEEFSTKIGFTVGDDDTVEEIINALK